MLSFRQWQSELCACCSSGGDGCLAIRSYRREPDLRLRISVRWSSSGELPGWPVAMGGEWWCIAVWNQRKNVKSSRQVSDLEEFWIQILEWYSEADFREWMKKKKVVKTVFYQMTEHPVPAPQAWTCSLWNSAPHPPTLFQFLICLCRGCWLLLPREGVLSSSDSYCCCWAAAWAQI